LEIAQKPDLIRSNEMSDIVELLDFSGTDITVSAFKIVAPNKYQQDGDEILLPFEIGFQQEQDGKLEVYVSDSLKELDSKEENVVKFTKLAEYCPKITDEVVLGRLFEGFFSEILNRSGEFDRQRDWYLVVPYNFPGGHRDEIRKALKRFNQVNFKGFLSDVLCAITYSNSKGNPTLAKTQDIPLFMFDFRSMGLKVWWIQWEEKRQVSRFQIKEVRLYPECHEATEVDICAWIRKSVRGLSSDQIILRGFGITTEEEKSFLKKSAKLLESMRDGRTCQPHLFISEVNVIKEGAKELIVKLRHPETLVKRLVFEYNMRFGIQLDEQKMFFLTPQEFQPPCEFKRAFWVEKMTKPLTVNFYGGLSDRVNSSVRLASIQIEESSVDNQYGDRFEFIAKVEFTDRKHGRLSIISPVALPRGEGAAQNKNVLSQDFKAPLLME